MNETEQHFSRNDQKDSQLLEIAVCFAIKAIQGDFGTGELTISLLTNIGPVCVRQRAGVHAAQLRDALVLTHREYTVLLTPGTRDMIVAADKFVLQHINHSKE